MIDFEAKIRFLRHISIKYSKIRLFWQNAIDIGKNLKAFGKKLNDSEKKLNATESGDSV